MVLLTYLAALIPLVASFGDPIDEQRFYLAQENEAMCNKFGRNPYFEPDMVLGKPWRIYYTWYVKLENKCLDMTFKNITRWTVDRFATDMGQYLESQPAWDAAMLVVSMGPASHQMLLFADQGPAGRVQGLPNSIRDANIIHHTNGVPLFKFQLKLIRDGKYLIMMDCITGVVSLSARAGKQPPNRAEIDAAAAEVGIGEGLHACLEDTNKAKNKKPWF